MSFTYNYPRPAVTTDVVLFCKDDTGKWQLLLIERRKDPFKSHWALPGGFLDENESPMDGAMRELHEKTGIDGVVLSPLCFRGAPGRDPRGHTVSLVFMAAIEDGRPAAQAADDAKHLDWHPIDALPALAFDHAEIVAEALPRLR